MKQPLRIALVGSAGVGKTTLAERLAAELGLPLSVDPVRGLLAELGLNAPNSLNDGSRLDLCQKVLARRIAFEGAHASFVADRAALDTAVYWLRWCPRGANDATAALFATARSHMTRYSHVFMLPWGALPLVDDATRTPDRWYQYGMHALTLGVLRDWNVPHLALPASCVAIEDRVEFCVNAVRD